MKKQLRVLYDMRSAIVHGGFEVMHPMRDETLDERVNGVFDRVLTASQYGLVLIVAAIQKMARENWSQLRFEEIIVGQESVRRVD